MFWQTPDVATKPEIDLACWAVVETDKGERDLVGIDLATGAGRSAVPLRLSMRAPWSSERSAAGSIRCASRAPQQTMLVMHGISGLPLMECSHGGT